MTVPLIFTFLIICAYCSHERLYKLFVKPEEEDKQAINFLWEERKNWKTQKICEPRVSELKDGCRRPPVLNVKSREVFWISNVVSLSKTANKV